MAGLIRKKMMKRMPITKWASVSALFMMKKWTALVYDWRAPISESLLWITRL
ncbi:hypothetical protein ACT7DA_14575 [Bacillus pacificus]